MVTLRDFLARIQPLYGKAERIWVMDRGIPTEEVLADLDLLGEIAGGGIYGDLLPHSVEVEALRYAFDVWDCRS